MIFLLHHAKLGVQSQKLGVQFWGVIASLLQHRIAAAAVLCTVSEEWWEWKCCKRIRKWFTFEGDWSAPHRICH